MADSTARAAKGGRARAEALTPEQRSESARRAVTARWAKTRAPAPEVSVTVDVGSNVSIPPKRIDVEVTEQYDDEPLIISGEVTTWNVNSPSYVITLTKIESSTL